MFEMKSAENIRDKLIEAGEKFNLLPDEVLNLNVVTDGAANISSMAKSMENILDDVGARDPRKEFDEYFNEFVGENTNICDSPLKYWSTKKSQYPILSSIAFRTFTNLASETVCERAFSAVKRVVSDDRMNLSPDLVETLMLAYFYSNEIT
uniref:Dimer_Tnp_hAT domain-containing protein n=1 Tax=Caenorhabditis japonica TaxID=281687 RepID=A0A8R1EB27_CAEJA